MKDKTRILFVGAGPLPAGGAGASMAAPGVANRLWHFVQPAAAAGHPCAVLLIEPDAPEPGPEGVALEETQADGHTIHTARISVETAKQPELLHTVVAGFGPGLIAGAGTLQASATACAIAGERPVWVDYFGDPLAEIQAKSDWLGDAMPVDEAVMVWQMMMATQRRADAFSTVSRRQADALLGQLLVQGRMDFGYRGKSADRPADAGSSRIAFMPCCLKSFDGFPRLDRDGREALLQSRGIPSDAKFALWSGGFNAWADPRLLAEVVIKLLQQDTSAHFVVTGGELPGYLSKVYEIFSAEISRSDVADRAHLLGWLPHDESLRWLVAADAALLVDRPCAETRLGARNRLLYHAAANCPVVATRGTEVVDEMAQAGALMALPGHKPEQVVAALHECLREEGIRAEVSEKALQFCKKHYTFRASAGPFLRFAASPTRAAQPPALEQPGANAASWIAHYLDVEARHGEWEALKQFNEGGKLARIKNLLTRKPKVS